MSHKRLLDPGSVTSLSIDAFAQLHPHVTRLHTTPPYNILILVPPTRPPTHPPPRTCLVSGGGDGHYPAHIGYIGAGMLTAAVCGNVFASPSAEAVAAAIEGVQQCCSQTEAGQPVDVLLVAKNYTGDRLNFRLALHLLSQAQRPEQPAAWVDMVVVGDDVALPRGQSIAGRRGLAGTLLVHKLSGAAAAEGGRGGREVKAIAEEAAARLCTLGVAFTGCSVGDAGGESEMAQDEFELGLGIHGESGVSRLKLESVDALVRRMADMLLSRDPARDYFWREAAAGDERIGEEAEVSVVLLVNNLSGMQLHELNVIAQTALSEFSRRRLRVERLLKGTLMTAWDMRGFSLTLLRLPADGAKRRLWMQWFDAPTDAPAWPVSTGCPPALHSRPSITLHSRSASQSAILVSSSSPPPFSPLLIPLLRAVAEALVSWTDELNALDSHSGDGDCGSTFRQGAQLLLLDLRSSAIDLSSLPALYRSLRKYSAAMGGTSGAICSLLFLSAAAAAHASSSALPSKAAAAQAVQALRSAVDEVSRYSGAKQGDRTLLDALMPALDAALSAAQQQSGLEVEAVLSAAVDAAVAGLERTRGIVARAGRASYVRAEVVKDVDPGAKAVCIVLQAMHRACREYNYD